MVVVPPRPRDLPLNALRAFEAAARLESFVAAAGELGVTAGAVTAHIKSLEAELGARLFTRGARGVSLTPLGQRALPEFIAAFDALGEAVEGLRKDAQPHTVHIATLPAIAQLWLSPRLPAIRQAMPELSISITAMEAPPNLKRSPYDFSLFYSREPGDWLVADEIYPVCAPALAARLERPEDLLTVPCLSDATWAEDWGHWADKAMPGMAFRPRGSVFSLYALALAEALNGAGVLIGHDALVAEYVERGELVVPFGPRVATGLGLGLWTSRPARRGSPVKVLIDWLRDNP